MSLIENEKKLDTVVEARVKLERVLRESLKLYTTEPVTVFDSKERRSISVDNSVIFEVEDYLAYGHYYKLDITHSDILYLEYITKSIQYLLSSENDLIDKINSEVISDLVNDMFS